MRTHAPQLSAAYLEHILGGSEGSQPPSLPATPPQLSRLSSSSFGGDSFGGESTPPAAKTPTEDEGLSKELVHLYLERVLEEAKAGGFPKRGFEAENGTAERENKWDERAKSETRLKLLSSLERSTAYDPRRLLSEIPDGILLYERAILLGRLGKHRQALFLYARALRDPPAAEEYCRRLHEEGGHVAGGIEQSIGVDTGAVIGGRGQGERGGEGRVVGGPRKGETEGVNMFLTLLEVSNVGRRGVTRS